MVIRETNTRAGIPTGCVFLMLVATVVSASGANWPAWRGPEGSGVSPETNLPLHWSTNENVRWSVPLPAPGNSTPVVWGDKVFITQGIDKDHLRRVMCFKRSNGELLWQTGTVWEEKDQGGESNPPCSPSPVTDGERVIAWFGSAGLFCYDLAGHELWRRDLGRQSHVWGYASSPVLYGDLCVLNFGPGPRCFVIAMEKKTGKTVWQYDVPPIGPDAKWEDFGGTLEEWKQLGSPKVADVSGSCATPLLVQARERDELVVAFELRVLAFAPKTGQRLWVCAGPNTCAYSSPCFGDGLIYLTESGSRNIAMAIRPGGSDDVTLTHRLWHFGPPASKICIGSPVIYQGHVYQVTSGGAAQCLDLRTGKVVWDQRLVGSGTRNASWSSVLLAGDRLYVPNQNADVFVLRASTNFTCLATNSIGGEKMNASLAVSNGDVFLRTHKRLWCIAEK
jgi:outer membrane protein assembly factor BamB